MEKQNLAKCVEEAEKLAASNGDKLPSIKQLKISGHNKIANAICRYSSDFPSEKIMYQRIGRMWRNYPPDSGKSTIVQMKIADILSHGIPQDKILIMIDKPSITMDEGTV